MVMTQAPRPHQGPEVSILLPFYNAAATLAECLASIARQTLPEYELIAVDDGSTDNSAELLRARAANDRRIRLFQPGRRGLVEALNIGLRAARAPLVARMDADDRMHPDRLRLQRDFMLSNIDIALVGTCVRLFPEDRIQAGYREYIRWQNQCLAPRDIRNAIYVESPFAHPSVMFRRDVVTHLGGYREGDFPEDYELWLRLHHHGYAMAKLPETLLDWRDGDARLSRTHPAYAREAFDRLRAEYLRRDPRLAAGRDLVYWGAGRRTRKRAQHLIQHGFRPSAWIDIDARKIGNRVGGAWVRPVDWLDRRPLPFVLSYVTNHGAREWIRARLERLGYLEGNDFLFIG